MVNNNYVKINQKSLTYPSIKIPTNPAMEKRINRLIKNKAEAMLPSGRYANMSIISAASQYDIEANQNRILSIRLENFYYPENFANGVTTVSGITVNLITGRKYRLKDLFTPDSNYEMILTQIIEKQIEEKDIPLLDDYPGIKGNEEFYLTPDSLVIIYQRYELTPGYYGVLEFEIPYDEISFIIDDKGPIGNLT